MDAASVSVRWAYAAGMRAALALLVLAPLTARANPAPLGGPGRTLAPRMVRDAASVALLEEKVVITDGLARELPEMCPGCGPMRARAVGYEGSYLLVNRSSMAVRLRVGFPVVEGNVKAGGDYGSLEDFKVRVRGIPVAVADEPVVSTRLQARDDLVRRGIAPATLKALESRKLAVPAEGDPDLLDLSALGTSEARVHDSLAPLGVGAAQRKLVEEAAVARLKDEDDFAVEARLTWRSFEVAFEPSERVTVKVSYSSVHGWQGEESYRFAYVLTTGARWSEKIERCQIVIHPAEGRALKDYQVRPKGAREVEGALVLEFKEFRPSENVVVQVQPRE